MNTLAESESAEAIVALGVEGSEGGSREKRPTAAISRGIGEVSERREPEATTEASILEEGHAKPWSGFAEVLVEVGREA